MIKFENIEILYGLAIIPVLIIVFIIAYHYKKRSLKKFGDLNVISGLMPYVSKSRPILKFIFLMLALVSIIFAAAGPKFGSKLEKVKREGVELIIALDVSNSMLAEDISPNRLERAKRSISKMIDELRNDKIGLIIFAGDAYVQVPITTDYSAVKMYLETIDTDIVPRQGTAIGSAIDLGLRSFDEESKLDKAMIIITDGENHQGNADEAAEEAKDEGIAIHTIGMGSSKGVPIPLKEQNGQVVYQKDEDGSTVISKLNEKVLKNIAAETGGSYSLATNSSTGLKELFKEISEMEKKEIESKIYADYEHRFQYLIGLALLFLLIDIVLLDRRNLRFMKYNLFKIRE
ncbi:MAG: vWA domain-containing protein [Bacteroidota bacterium]